jgi:putative tryptophan/tyrosine transport system substrate-binding protein
MAVPTSLCTIEATAAPLGGSVTKAGVRGVTEVEQAIVEFARVPNGGLIYIQSSLFGTARERIAALALHHGLPGMFHLRSFVTSGGLASYGIDLIARYAQAPS